MAFLSLHIENAQEPITPCMAARQQTAKASSYPGMERWRGRTALVTGASSGIGYELAGQLAQLGMDVVGCAWPNVAKFEVYMYNTRDLICQFDH